MGVAYEFSERGITVRRVLTFLWIAFSLGCIAFMLFFYIHGV